MDDSALMPEEGGEFGVAVERPSRDVAIVAVRGEADLHSAPELRDRLGGLVDDGTRRVLVDLSETTFIDSMALGVLLGCTKRLRADGGQLELIVTKPDLLRVFEITMLDRILVLHPSREVALELELAHRDGESA